MGGGGSEALRPVRAETSGLGLSPLPPAVGHSRPARAEPVVSPRPRPPGRAAPGKRRSLGCADSAAPAPGDLDGGQG